MNIDPFFVFLLFNITVAISLYYVIKACFSKSLGWLETYLRWEAMPLWLFILNFGFLATINWTYESKFFLPIYIHGQWDNYTGRVLFGLAVCSLFPTSGLLFLLRWIWARSKGTRKTWGLWIISIPLSLVAGSFLLWSLFILWMGPAGFEMLQQRG